ncbi:hypothetical protein AB0E25_39345 [Streptomyces bobili]|uniref:hypothetical protein n=1 Tax=Streptomyces bobili TaxID=67280 RepID=UPI0033EE6A6A
MLNLVEYMLDPRHADEFESAAPPTGPDLSALQAALVSDLDVIEEAASFAIENLKEARDPETFMRDIRMIPGFHLTALPTNMPKQKMKPTEEPHISITTGPRSSSNIPRRVFDVPDSFQATVKLTVRFNEPAISSARHAGIGLLGPSGGRYFGASKRIDTGGHLVGTVHGNVTGDGSVADGSNSTTGGEQHLVFRPEQPVFDETVHLRITVRERKIREAEFSRDGVEFTPIRLRLINSIRPAAEKKLILFAFSGDDTSFTASFSEPKIVDLVSPPG